jgi:putative membrane-bound dehydrogenase-like protein
MIRRWAGALLLIAACAGPPSPPPSAAPPPTRVQLLFLGDRGHHEPAQRAHEILPVLTARGINLTYTENPADLNAANLGRFDALLVYANIDAIAPEQEKALLDFVAGGGGLAAIHCASYCFRNSDAYVALVGAQFKSHGTGTFRTTIANRDHPITRGFDGFESWDETYVHARHNSDRVVLEKRDDEPYTWVRTHGRGRVFYTAWGHDQRTWGNPGFHELLERGIRWAAGDTAGARRPDLKPTATREAKLPYYPAGEKWGTTGEPIRTMQVPLPPDESIKHLILPPGFEARLFAAEPDIVKPIAMAWDERGRLWIAETVDYPNELKREPPGRDRIKICEDTDGDGRADRFTIFAEGLSIPTGLAFARGGLVVLSTPRTLFLKDTDGDGRADVREVLFEGWGTQDTHATASNLRPGLDNWLWCTVGYSGFDGGVGGRRHRFGQGVVRFRPDGSALEFVASTSNNTWGLGLSEEGDWFVSTANNEHLDFLAIPNRLYEGVEGWHGRGIDKICDHAAIHPVNASIRQVDFHGGFTAAAGAALYTARAFPPAYWNRVAFVAEPTGHLLHQCRIEPSGSGFVSRDGWNFLASTDEWTAPIAAEVGPDGALWVIDWYNFVVQHNPTPHGFTTGRGNAYETPERDKTHGRIYRIVHRVDAPPRLDPAAPETLVAALKHSNMFWRLTAQRLLVERGKPDVRDALVALTKDPGAPEAAIHALWALHGLGQTGRDTAAALKHPTAAVRKNAALALPPTADSAESIVSAGLLTDPDPRVRRDALLALSAMPPAPGGGTAIFGVLSDPANARERWITDAATAAAARNDAAFLRAALAGTEAGPDAAPTLNLIVNPSFEEADGDRPRGWAPRHYSGRGEQRWVEGGRTGKRCLELRSNAGADTSWFTEVAVKPKTNYRLSAWIKTQQVRGAMGALLNIHGVGQTVTGAVRGNSDWRRVELVFNTNDLSRVGINCLLGGWGRTTGVAWYDDVALEEVRASAAVESALRVVAGAYARRAPADSAAATLAALAGAEPTAARALLDGLVAGWPAESRPQFSDADRAQLAALKDALPKELLEPLLALSERWGQKDLFNVDRGAVLEKLAAGVRDGQPDAAERLVLLKDDEATAELVLSGVTPQAAPDRAQGLLAALARSARPETGAALIARWTNLTPTTRPTAVEVLMRRPAWTRALLDALESGAINRSDLSIQQWFQLSRHPDPAVAKRSETIHGRTTRPDRQAVVEQLMGAARRRGDPARGAKTFEQHCAACHTIRGQGAKIGPELTGIGARARADILVEILDPNRSVEANYRYWAVTTSGGEVLSGRIVAETQTTIELMDLLGQQRIVQRKQVTEMVVKTEKPSMMTEGFEILGEEGLSDLLEFLTSPGP